MVDACVLAVPFPNTSVWDETRTHALEADAERGRGPALDHCHVPAAARPDTPEIFAEAPWLE